MIVWYEIGRTTISSAVYFRINMVAGGTQTKKWRSIERLDAPTIFKCNVNVM